MAAASRRPAFGNFSVMSGGGRVMHALGLTPEQFRHIVRACERVRINPLVPDFDLQRFLTARLSDDFPDVAERIARFDDRQLADLREEVVTVLRGHTESTLWG
jgi:hypothetical protein